MMICLLTKDIMCVNETWLVGDDVNGYIRRLE